MGELKKQLPMILILIVVIVVASILAQLFTVEESISVDTDNDGVMETYTVRKLKMPSSLKAGK